MNQTENNRPLVDGVPALERKLKEVREAQAQFATFSQEQVDQIFRAAALAANHARLPLAKMAVEETGMGVVEDKVIKKTMPLSISTTPISIPRPVASSNRIPPMARPVLQNRSA